MRMRPVKVQHGTHESYAGSIPELTTTGSDVMTDSNSTSRIAHTKVRIYWSVGNGNDHLYTVHHLGRCLSAVSTLRVGEGSVHRAMEFGYLRTVQESGLLPSNESF